jgi:NitT/TauT family transport system substrate-binding protein
MVPVASMPSASGWVPVISIDRTVGILLSGASSPVISKKPDGAYTHAVFDAASKL